MLKAGLLCYSLCSAVDWPAVPRSPDGWSRAEPEFPVLCSGRLGAEYSADSGCCEVGLHLTFVFACVILWFRFLVILLLMAVDVWWMARLHGTTLVGCHLFSMGGVGWNCRVTVSLCYWLSSNSDDSFQKTKASLPFCLANCARTVSTFMCLSCFLSKNENNNGFGVICLDSSPFDYKRVANIHFTVVFRIVFLGFLV